MLRHLLKTGDLTSRSERNAALTRTLSKAFRDRHKEHTNLWILAANEDTLLATKRWDALHHLGSCNRYLKASLYHRRIRKVPQNGIFLPEMLMNHCAKFYYTSFILGGEIRNCTNTHKNKQAKQTVTDISATCL